jgi:hypothetical protein
LWASLWKIQKVDRGDTHHRPSAGVLGGALMDTPDSLARDMLKAAAEAIVGARGIVAKGSLNIKNEARKNVAAVRADPQRARRQRDHLRHPDRRQGPRHPWRDRLRQGPSRWRAGQPARVRLPQQRPAPRPRPRVRLELPRFEDAIALMAKNLL